MTFTRTRCVNFRVHQPLSCYFKLVPIPRYPDTIFHIFLLSWKPFINAIKNIPGLLSRLLIEPRTLLSTSSWLTKRLSPTSWPCTRSWWRCWRREPTSTRWTRRARPRWWRPPPAWRRSSSSPRPTCLSSVWRPSPSGSTISITSGRCECFSIKWMKYQYQ